MTNNITGRGVSADEKLEVSQPEPCTKQSEAACASHCGLQYHTFLEDTLLCCNTYSMWEFGLDALNPAQKGSDSGTS